MRKLTLTIICALVALAAAATKFSTVGAGTRVEVEFLTPDIVRVVKYPDGNNPQKQSLSVTLEPRDVRVSERYTADGAVYTTSGLRVEVRSGVVTVSDRRGRRLVTEAGPAVFKPIEDVGKATYRVGQDFRLDPSEEIFGLGILQNGKMSQRGTKATLRPDNIEDGIPFFQSTKGYGLFWDNYSATDFDDTEERTRFESTVGDMVDYYVINGGSADGVIAGVRELTGDVPMVPLWAYGFFQSRERYTSQREITDVLRRYRETGVPIDCMIQDWQYWGPNYLWNAMEFLNPEFPKPQRMIDEIHNNNARCIISIWQSFGPMTKQYRELADKGLLLSMETWPQSGISHEWPPRMDYPSGVLVCDVYSPETLDIYWKHLRRLYDLNLDGWWMDSTEPDHHNKKEADYDHMTAMGSYRSVLGAFPLRAVGGVYDRQRATSDSTRVFILTRSGSFGQQRYGANVWSGDVVSTWDMLRKQIPAGLNFSLTGNPNFNSDLGGFFAGSYNRAWNNLPGYENPAYRELYARWMQQGVFTPMMRSHGTEVPRELYYYGTAGEPAYDALLGAIKLRYRLVPYIYSTARQVSADRGTFMRALVMDFPNDRKAVGQTAEYMFGDAILATPVVNAMYTPEVIRHDSDANAGWDKNTGRRRMELSDSIDFTVPNTHTVYLPAGTDWYYFPTSERFRGGRDVELQVTLTDIPFFVKAGSILPIGPDVQYIAEKPWDDLEIRVYPGADGSFTLYEDEGDSYNYEKGAFTEIPMTWHNTSRTLAIGPRSGAFDGMLASRRFRVVDMSTGRTAIADYDGSALKIRL